MAKARGTMENSNPKAAEHRTAAFAEMLKLSRGETCNKTSPKKSWMLSRGNDDEGIVYVLYR